jgi:hypothetical protein
MLSKWDELLCHQLPHTMDHVHTDNPEWTERIYVSIYNVRDKDTIVGSAWVNIPTKTCRTDSPPYGTSAGSIIFACRGYSDPI